LQSLVKDHPTGDGNTDLARLATAVVLQLIEVAIEQALYTDVHDLVMAIASGDQEIPEIATGLRRLLDGR